MRSVLPIDSIPERLGIVANCIRMIENQIQARLVKYYGIKRREDADVLIPNFSRMLSDAVERNFWNRILLNHANIPPLVEGDRTTRALSV